MKKYYPVMLDIQDKKCLVIGGGSVACRKVISLLSYGAKITVISPNINNEMKKFIESGKIELILKEYNFENIREYCLVFAATGDKLLNKAIYEQAQPYNVLVNVVDDPEICNFIVPAKFEQGDLTVSVSTNGKSPTLAKKICGELKNQFGSNYAVFLNLLGELRLKAAKNINNTDKRTELYKEIIDSDFLERLKNEPEEQIREEISEIYKRYKANQRIKS